MFEEKKIVLPPEHRQTWYEYDYVKEYESIQGVLYAGLCAVVLALCGSIPGSSEEHAHVVAVGFETGCVRPRNREKWTYRCVLTLCGPLLRRFYKRGIRAGHVFYFYFLFLWQQRLLRRAGPPVVAVVLGKHSCLIPIFSLCVAYFLVFRNIVSTCLLFSFCKVIVGFSCRSRVIPPRRHLCLPRT